MRIVDRTLMFEVGRHAIGVSFRRPFVTDVWTTATHFHAVVIGGRPHALRRFGCVAYVSFAAKKEA
jgi:hypothetical protein